MEVKGLTEAEPLPHTRYVSRNLPQPRISKEKEVRGGSGSQSVLKPVTSVAWSCDGRHFATGSVERLIRVWDAAKLDIAYSFILSAPASSSSSSLAAVAALAFSPTEPNILIATTKLSTPNTATVWDIKKPSTPLATFNLPASSLRIAFHPSGRQFAVVCEHGNRDQALFYWLGPYGADGSEAWALREDLHMGCAGVDLGVHLDEFHGFTFSHSGKIIFTGSANGGLNAWKFREAAPVSDPRLTNGTTIPMPRNLNRLLEAESIETPNSPRSRTPVDEEDERQTEKRDEPDNPAENGTTDVEMNGEEGAADASAVQATSIDGGEGASLTDKEGEDEAGGTSEAANGDAMEVDGGEPAKEAASPAPRTIDTTNNSEPSTPKPEAAAVEAPAETVDVWAKQLTLLRQTPVHVLNCYAIALCPTGRHIATGGADAMVNLFRTQDWIGVKTFLTLPGIVDHLAFSYDGEFLAASGDDKTIYIFSTHTGATLHRIVKTAAVASLAWSPTRNTLAYCTKPTSSTGKAAAVTTPPVWWFIDID